MARKTLVLGASLKSDRYSNKVIHKLRSVDIEVYAFGLKAGKVADVSVDTTLHAYEDIETVTLYIGPKNQPDYYDYILQLKPNRVIFNPGTENLEFIHLLKEHGIETEVACSLVLLSTNQY